MPGLPIVTGIGTLTASPELRFTPAGVAVTNFTLAFNERFVKDGEWQDGNTTFLRCVAWRDMAQNIAESLEKGARVLVSGDLRPNDYEDEDGNMRYGFELLIVEIGPALKFATVKMGEGIRVDVEPDKPARVRNKGRTSGRRTN